MYFEERRPILSWSPCVAIHDGSFNMCDICFKQHDETNSNHIRQLRDRIIVDFALDFFDC
ncbi:hypothetical protein D3C87_1855640 [compost metagenome]